MVSEQSPQGGDHAGPSAERRQDERYGKNHGSSAHCGASPLEVASIGSFRGKRQREPRSRQRRSQVSLVIWGEAPAFLRLLPPSALRNGPLWDGKGGWGRKPDRKGGKLSRRGPDLVG